MTDDFGRIPTLCGEYLKALVSHDNEQSPPEVVATEAELLPLLESIGAVEPDSAFVMGTYAFQVRTVDGVRRIIVDQVQR